MLKSASIFILLAGIALSSCCPISKQVCGRAQLSSSGRMALLMGSRSAIDPTEFWLDICDGGECKTAIHWARGNQASFKVDGRDITMRMQRSGHKVEVTSDVKVNSVLYHVNYIETEGPIPAAEIPGDIRVVDDCWALRPRNNPPN